MSDQISSAEHAVLDFLDDLESQASRAKEQSTADWDRCLQVSRGQDWPDRSRAPMWKVNLIGPTVQKEAALLTEIKPSIRVVPRQSGLDATAHILERTIDAGWEEYQVQQRLEDIALMLGHFGCGFGRLWWDRLADDGEGDIVFSAYDPRDVLINPNVRASVDLPSAQDVTLFDTMPLWELWKRYPGRGSLVEPMAPHHERQGATPTTLWSRAQSAMPTVFKQGASEIRDAIPMALVRTYQFHDPTLNPDGSPRYPNGRFVVRGGERVILEDRPNPYWDGGWDVEMLDARPDPDHPWGTSRVDGLRRLQEAVNRIGDLFVRNRVTSGNIRVVASNHALDSDSTQRLKALNAVLLTHRTGETVQVQMPENMPADMLQFIDHSVKLMEYLTGMSDPTVDGRFEVRSGVQFEGLQAASQVPIRAQARRLESFLQRIGQKWISRIFQFMTNDRLMSYVGPQNAFMAFSFERQLLMREIVTKAQEQAVKEAQADGRPYDETVMPDLIEAQARKASKRFRFKIEPGSSLASTKIQRAMLFAQLAQNGLLPGEKVLEELGFVDALALIEKAMQQRQILGMTQQSGASSGRRRG